MKKCRTENIRGAPFVRKGPHLVACLRRGCCKRGNPTIQTHLRAYALRRAGSPSLGWRTPRSAQT